MLLVSGVPHSDSMCLQIILHVESLKIGEYISLCCALYPCCLSSLYITVYLHFLIPNHSLAPALSPRFVLMRKLGALIMLPLLQITSKQPFVMLMDLWTRNSDGDGLSLHSAVSKTSAGSLESRACGHLKAHPLMS